MNSRRRVNSDVMCSFLNIARVLTLLLVSLLLCDCSIKNRIVEPADDLAQIETKIKSVLPAGWSLKREGKTFQLTRSENLWVYGSMQMDIRAPLEEWAKKYGTEVTYTITLRFAPRLPNEQYAQLKQERAPYERILNEGAPTIKEWERGVNEFNARQLPIYFTDRYSIYVEKSDGYLERVYPESAGDECKQVIGSLDRLFHRYEPATGKTSDFQVHT